MLAIQSPSSENLFSIYIHIPFCIQRCGYCDFVSNPIGNDRSPIKGYSQLICKELDLLLEQNPNLTDVYTIFFGGGTPTLLETDDFEYILNHIRKKCNTKNLAEVTTEANPDTVTLEMLEKLYNIGVTRISFGMQSAVNSVLKTLDRRHNPEVLPDLIKTAKDIGLKTSVDLIYGTPGETMSDWEKSLTSAINMQPNHISCYALTLEENVPMAKRITRGELPEVDEDFQSGEYEFADNLLSKAGYEWYEISNWGEPSLHNLAYWDNITWLGLGTGAHSHVLPNTRFWNTSSLLEYKQQLLSGKLAIDETEILDTEALVLEEAMLQARLNRPIVTSSEKLRKLVTDHLITADTHTPTIRGRMLNDEIIRILAATDCPASTQSNVVPAQYALWGIESNGNKTLQKVQIPKNPNKYDIMVNVSNKVNFAFTIAGSETTGGAGFQVDIKTFQEYNVYGNGALTCIVAFDPKDNWAHRFTPIAQEVLEDQIETAFAFHKIDAMKIGMLGSIPTIETVAKALADAKRSGTLPQHIVLDPVLICKGQEAGAALDTDNALKELVLPYATIVTPNAFETGALAGVAEPNTVEELKVAASNIASNYNVAVYAKGDASLPGDTAVDVLVSNGAIKEFSSPKIGNERVSGAGCTVAAAITAGLAKSVSTGESLDKVVAAAKKFVSKAIDERIVANTPFTTAYQGANRYDN